LFILQFDWTALTVATDGTNPRQCVCVLARVWDVKHYMESIYIYGDPFKHVLQWTSY